MRKTTPRISDNTSVWLEQNFKTFNAGTEYVIEAFRVLYSRAIEQARHKFTPEEQELIVDAFQARPMSSVMAGEHLRNYCCNGMDLDKLDRKWSVQRNAIISKMEALTHAECVCLEVWASGCKYQR